MGVEENSGPAQRRPRVAGGMKMSDKIYEVPAEWKSRAYMDEAKYQEMYARSLKDPDAFWADEAKRIHWYKPAEQNEEHLV